MVGVVERLKGLVRAAMPDPPALEPIKSWMHIFQAKVKVVRAATVDELAEAVRAGGYFCLGQSHSYNGVQIVGGATALNMRQSKLSSIAFDKRTGKVTVGPAVSVLELKKFLVKEGRRLINSGNYMEQTVIGALATGTHGYGENAVMAESVTALEFLDGKGERRRLTRRDRDFKYAALAFGTIAPIVSVTLNTAPLERFEVRTIICRLKDKAAHVGPEHAVMYAIFPYSDRDNPTIALQTLKPAPVALKAQRTSSPFFTLRAVSEFIIHRYWVFDRLFPPLRRPFQRLISRINVSYCRTYTTEPDDLDYLYDPAPGLEDSRSPNILTKMLSPTHTAYNLAFFVPLKDADRVVQFVMNQADEFRSLGFYLKSMIGVRELSSRSKLPFAGNYREPVAAIDLFADVRYYAWLERIQRDTLSYFNGVRPHWGKSAIVEEFADSLGTKHMDAHKKLHDRLYEPRQLRTTRAIRRLFGISVEPPQ